MKWFIMMTYLKENDFLYALTIRRDQHAIFQVVMEVPREFVMAYVSAYLLIFLL